MTTHVPGVPPLIGRGSPDAPATLTGRRPYNAETDRIGGAARTMQRRGRLDGQGRHHHGRRARHRPRSTAVLFAREGAAVVGVDVAGPVSTASIEVDAGDPSDELAETGRLVAAEGGALARRERLTSATSARCARRPRRPWRLFRRHRHPLRQRGHTGLQAAAGDGGRRLARPDRRQPQRHRQRAPRRRATHRRARRRPDHPDDVHAGPARHQVRRQLFRLEMGHPRA